MSVDPGLADLFRTEVETHAATLSTGLIDVERVPGQPPARAAIESLMRAAHSIKGAARIVGVPGVAQLAHVMEDLFCAAEADGGPLRSGEMALLFRATDLFAGLAKIADGAAGIDNWSQKNQDSLSDLERELKATVPARLVEEPPAPKPAPVVQIAAPSPPVPPLAVAPPPIAAPEMPVTMTSSRPTPSDRVLRVAAGDLDRLLGLASETLIESRRLHPFAEALRALAARQSSLTGSIGVLEQAQRSGSPPAAIQSMLTSVRSLADECRQSLNEQLLRIDDHARHMDDAAGRLHREILASRMRPFSDVVTGLPRLVRDVAQQLGKRVRLEIVGETTKVDRDLLDRLESSLGHIIRNAIDHGLESPDERRAAQKPEEGVLRIEARHRAGMLIINVSDDGRGVDVERVRRKAVDRRLVTSEIAVRLTQAEVLEFVFLSGFSTAAQVSDISGRGVGLDAVQTTLTQVGGAVRISSDAGKGTRFVLQMPVTLSVVRAAVVEIAGEPYAFPLGRIERLLQLDPKDIRPVEGKPYFSMEDQAVGLVRAATLLGLDHPASVSGLLPIIVIGGRQGRYGVVVDRFLGEQDLVVRRLDPRLGKIADIAAAAVMADGAPLLVVDVEDLCRSIEKRIAVDASGDVSLAAPSAPSVARARKRILVVDDSITVREVERQLLVNRGYEVTTAVDGVDGWNTLRGGQFDLVISDVDMPRMNGIELVRTIKQDGKLRLLPVVIVSYKDRQEDRLRGLEAGANSYLTKSSFHDQTLIRTVEDLIGAPEA